MKEQFILDFYENEAKLSKWVEIYTDKTKGNRDADVQGLRSAVEKYKKNHATYLLNLEWDNLQLQLINDKIIQQYEDNMKQLIKDIHRPMPEKILLNKEFLSKLNNLEKNILTLQKEILESEKKRERGLEWGF